MATYNGSEFVKEQLYSITESIYEAQKYHEFNYDFIIVDDCSKDDTKLLINELEIPNLHIYSNERNLGHVSSFERALTLATGDLIFLSDQDDIWTIDHIHEHIKNMPTAQPAARFAGLQTFSSSEHHREQIISPGLSTSKILNFSRILLGSSGCWGCTMCVNSHLRDIVLPFPKNVEAHELYIAIAATIYNNILFQREANVLHRIHDKNVTPAKRRALKSIVKTRILMLYQYLILSLRKVSNFHDF